MTKPSIQQVARDRLRAGDPNVPEPPGQRPNPKSSQQYTRFPEKERFERDKLSWLDDTKWKEKYNQQQDRQVRSGQTLLAGASAVLGASGQTEWSRAKKLAKGAVKGSTRGR